jgi:hypothetical protein
MKTSLHKIVITPIFTLLALTLPCAAQDQAQPATAEDWEIISDPIYDLINYEPVEPKLYRKVGGIVVPPTTGEVFVAMNRDYGVFKSTDHGETWEHVPGAPIQGRVYGDFGTDLDAQTGRFAIFMAETNRFDQLAIGGMTLDGGKTWTPIGRPSKEKAGKHDGYTWGSVNWSQEQPQTLLGKEHHAYIDFWLSRDAGKTWDMVDFKSRNVGIIDADTFVAGVESHVTQRKPEAETGIFRTTDGGKTWSKVHDAVVNGKIPQRWGSNFYWTTEEGILISRDAGATWQLLGTPLPQALYGPYFGLTEDHMMAVSADGLFESTDHGQTWTKLSELPPTCGHNVNGAGVSYGWDPQNRLIYAAPIGGDVFRLKLPK